MDLRGERMIPRGLAGFAGLKIKKLEQLNILRKQAAEGLTAEIRTVLRNPRILGQFIEQRSPWLNRQLLSAASNISEPFLVGMGLKVEKLNEESIEVTLPAVWKNRAQNSRVHVAALITLGEFASRLFWEHHLDLRSTELEAEKIEFISHRSPSGDLRGVFRISEGERESVLRHLREHGTSEVGSSVSIYDASERLVCEIDVAWRFFRQLSLPERGF
jgi:hypothetical protein